MADSTISALPASTVPLGGTEVLPIVQSGVTVQVAVADLTAARAVSIGNLGVGGASNASYGLILRNTALTGTQQFGSYYAPVGSSAATVQITGVASAPATAAASFTINAVYGFRALNTTKGSGSTITQQYGLYVDAQTNGATNYSIYTNAGLVRLGDTVTIIDNLVQGTAAKGINFTANTPAAGMTSQLLNWYEEGTWTPSQGAGLTVVGAFTSNGTYTRIGRQVTVYGRVAGATSVTLNVASILCSGLPFTATSTGLGVSTNSNNTATATNYVGNASKILYSNTAIAATPAIEFSVTYFA